MPNTEHDSKSLFSRKAKSGKDSAEPKSAEQRAFENPASQPIQPLPEGEKHDHLAKHEAQAEDRQEALLDEALEETFPGSDPISPKHIT
jgi:hypothetical protein